MIPVKKPALTAADYLCIGISPVLVMLLVGSLAFFLVEVFFHGPAIGGVRWVMFWFVMAVVLVSRIGIEQSTGKAAVYGMGLATATWLYLVTIHPAVFLGMLLLGIVWWCAHKLTWDCTLLDESQDASGNGLLQTAGDKKSFVTFVKTIANFRNSKKKPAAPHPPGLWVVYFSLAALPLFGLGQALLPAGDLVSRHQGFVLLFVYMIAALGLLLTTSFIGLRHYLRERYLAMPPMIAFGWLRFGVGIAIFVLVGAMILPRPGATDTWQALRYQIDYKLRAASDYAARFNPHGKGRGRTGDATEKSTADPSKKPSADSPAQPGSGSTPSPGQNGTEQNPNAPPSGADSESSGQLYHLFKILFLLTLAILAAWWIFRRRDLILQIIQSIIAAIKQFFQALFGLGSTVEKNAVPSQKTTQIHRPFAGFKNPFLTGKETVWTREQLVIYSYEALQAWAEEQGVPARPQQTNREFCLELSDRFPDIHPELNQMSFLYNHAAYRLSVPENSDLEPVKSLWRYLSNGAA
ncbi:MAG TPA: DUF4129 domain-containing protein [Verrucomicrobiae bacterium]|jgi:hypothetical protein